MMARTLYVGGLARDANTELLRSLFSQYGDLDDARVVMRPNDGQCRGFGYVTFANGEQAAKARAELAGHELPGGPIRVELAT